MKIQILSDLHTEHRAYEPPQVESDLVILAGDIGVGKAGVQWIKDHIQGRPAVYVAGNHEYYGRTLQKQLKELRALTSGTSIHFLENDEVQMGDVVILGCTLWTDFELFGDAALVGYDIMQRMSDFSVIRVTPKYRKLHYLDTVAFHRESVDWLRQKFAEHKGSKIVVVTHHAPSFESVTDRFKQSYISAAFASRLEDLVAESGAKLWVHGHVHSTHDYVLGETRVLCNPRGYPDEYVQGFDPELLVEV